jgi:NADH:ubiquinone oxidoreductase subunit H
MNTIGSIVSIGILFGGWVSQSHKYWLLPSAQSSRLFGACLGVSLLYLVSSRGAISVLRICTSLRTVDALANTYKHSVPCQHMVIV